jgi:hypothetical protein
MSESQAPKLIIPDDWKRDAKPEAPKAAAPAPQGAGGSPSIAVDSDWKKQAEAEKARLAAQEQAKPEGRGARGPDGRAMPPADFNALLGTLVTNALMYMGAFPDETGRAVVSLDHARFHIDLIQVLSDKVKGNITPAEQEEVNQVLNELRLRFVEITKAVAQAMANKKAPGSPAGPMGPAGLNDPGMFR